MKKQVIGLYAAILLILFVHPVFAANQVQEKTDYTIGPEDVLVIQVLGQKELQRTVEVSQEGWISFPLIGKILALGLTPFELEKDIERKLAEKKYLLDAQVSIVVKQYGSQKVYLLGEVKNPGRYFLKGKTHIFSILAEAGGLSDDAGNIVVIIRGYSGLGEDQSSAAEQTITVNLDDITLGRKPATSYVLPGDTIKVPESLLFYVTGEVKKAGKYKWEKQISVRRAIAMAGGHTKNGVPGRTTIQRLEKGTEVEFKPEMTEMIKPNDIVIIPFSYF